MGERSQALTEPLARPDVVQFVLALAVGRTRVFKLRHELIQRRLQPILPEAVEVFTAFPDVEDAEGAVLFDWL